MAQLLKEDLGYYLRLVVGFCAGALCGILKLQGFLGLILAILAYISSYLLLRKHDNSVKPGDGLIEYVGIWLTTWCVFYSLL